MRPCSIAIVTVLLLVLAACKQLDFYDILTSRDLERFAFRHAENPELGFDIAADPASENLAVLPKGIDFSRLIPTYTVDGYALFLDGERIESGSSRSGVSSGDADKDAVTITYTSYSYDGNSETEKIKLERPKAWFSQFAFLAADNEAMAAAGIGDLVLSLDDNEEARAAGDSAEGGMKGSSIWFYLPHTVPVKNLVPSFVKAGNSADIAASATVTLMKGESGDDAGIELVSGGTVLDLSEDRRVRVSVELDGTESIMDYRVALYRLTGLSIPGGENNLGDALYAPEINGDEITVKVPESADVSSLVTDFDFLGYSLTIGDKNFSAKARTNIDYREPVEFVVSTGTGLSHTYTVKVEAQPIVNSVSYNANGGMGDAPADTSTYRYKKSFAVQDHGSLTKSGYTFAGWNTKADGSGTLYQPGDSAVMGTQNVTLYAMWINVFTITYYANGGTGDVPIDGTNYRCRNSFTVLGQGSLTKSGYTFAGWNTKADGSGTLYQPGESVVMGTQDVTLYAVWVNVFKVSYDANGGTGSVPLDDSLYRTGDPVTVREAGTLSREHYTFSGWNTKADGSGSDYLPGALFSIDAANMTLYARWGEIKVSAVTLSDSTVLLNIASPAKQLTATPQPSNALDKAINWSSSDPSVATVSTSGLVSAASDVEGTAVITATAASGVGKSCSVTVDTIAPGEVTINGIETSSVSMTVTWDDPAGEFDHIGVTIDSASTSPVVKDIKSVNFTGLSASTTYKLFFQSVDAHGNVSEGILRSISTCASGAPAVEYVKITTAAELDAIDANANTLGQCYILNANIDLDPTVYTTAPINGTFTGTIEGNDHVIKNLKVNFATSPAFINSNAGVIQNISFDNAAITAGESGAVIAFTNTGTITNCSASGTISGSGQGFGGLVSHNKSPGVISYCHADVAVTCNTNSGGLAAVNYSIIEYCYSTGNVKMSGLSSAANIGGLVGNNQKTIRYCYATGDVSDSDSGASSLGGLVGTNIVSGNVHDCYSLGTVSGSLNGYGGLIGSSSLNVKNSYSIGFVSGPSLVGGLIGNRVSGTVSGCFYDTTVTGLSDTGKGEPKDTSLMKQQSTYAGWDFVGDANGTDDIWSIDPAGVINNGYPYLTKLPPK